MSPRYTYDASGHHIKKVSDPKRLEAQAAGHKHYLGGRCRNCECDALRYTSTGQCVACVLKRSVTRNRTPKARAWRRQWANERNRLKAAERGPNDDLI